MNLGTQKWKKAQANFARVRDDMRRCGAVWRAKACNSQGQGNPPWAGHAAAKAKAALYGHAAKARAHSQSQGRLL